MITCLLNRIPVAAGLDWLDKLKGRLSSIHLHDNDGRSDQHRIPFTGTVDWPRLAGLIAGLRIYGRILRAEDAAAAAKTAPAPPKP